eukprot:TRINITY_DN1100_c0_g1_i1.p1 TRINITY_DN1100_c0_g1~~TRINITY_DN1100_c0_g1_i1.p1  ORF type:complete len:175 (+),score=25.96 TRINITY_DN1100_c0_g1_i1:52-576(+)
MNWLHDTLQERGVWTYGITAGLAGVGWGTIEAYGHAQIPVPGYQGFANNAGRVAYRTGQMAIAGFTYGMASGVVGSIRGKDDAWNGVAAGFASGLAVSCFGAPSLKQPRMRPPSLMAGGMVALVAACYELQVHVFPQSRDGIVQQRSLAHQQEIQRHFPHASFAGSQHHADHKH